jgi:tetratricopeptide (TPR) repeat protein
VDHWRLVCQLGGGLPEKFRNILPLPRRSNCIRHRAQYSSWYAVDSAVVATVPDFRTQMPLASESRPRAKIRVFPAPLRQGLNDVPRRFQSCIGSVLRLVILGPVVTVLTMSDSTAVNSVEAEALKEQGNVAYRNGDFQSALQLYSQAIDVDPKSSKYLVNRSLCHASLCNWSESLADAKKALTLEANSQKAHYRAVKALFELGRFKEARLAILNGLKECGESKEMRQLEDELMTRTGIPLRPKSTDFEIIGELGDGNFSKVYKAQHRATQKVYAIKVGVLRCRHVCTTV